MSLSNNSTPSQSDEIVDPEGSYKKDNSKPVNSNQHALWLVDGVWEDEEEEMDPEGSCKKGNSKPVNGNYRKCPNCGGKMKKYVQHNCPPDENGAILSTIWGSFE